MNSKCDKEFCPYKETCLINDKEKINKCTGIIGIKNPHHKDYSATGKTTN